MVGGCGGEGEQQGNLKKGDGDEDGDDRAAMACARPRRGRGRRTIMSRNNYYGRDDGAVRCGPSIMGY